jgi:serine phosphatase RsbU (regulator of sigma subunit)
MKKLMLALIISIPTVLMAQSGGVYVSNIQLLNKAEKWCWSIEQDNNQNMLFGVERGVIVYDGVNQELIKTPITPLTLKNDNKNNVVFIAGSETIGVFNYSQKGNSEFQKMESRKDNVFNKIHLINDTVYFISDSLILVYNAQSFDKITEYTTNDLIIEEVLEFKGQLFFVIEYFLHRIIDDKLTEISNVDFPVDEFAYGVSIDENRIILGTSGNTTYSFDGKNFNSFELTSPFFDNNRITDGYLYTDSTLIISSLAGGIALFDYNTNKITKQINYFNGLPDDEIRATFVDKNNGIWVSHEFGISRIDLNQGIESYSYYPGLKGSPIAINFFNNNLYVSSNDGLFILDEIKNYEEVKVNVPVSVVVELPKKDNNTQSYSAQEESESKQGFSFFRSKKKKAADKKTDEVNITPAISENKKQTITIQQTQVIKKRSLKSIGHYFKLVDGMFGKYSLLVPFNNYLLVAGNNGLFAVSNKKAEPILKNTYIVNIYTTGSNSEFYCCTENGLYKISRADNRWKIDHFAQSTGTIINSVANENDGNWVIAFDNILIRAELKNNKINVKKEIDLPENPGQTFVVKNINDSLMVFTSNKIFHFTKTGDLNLIKDLNIDNYIIHNQNNITWLFNNGEWSSISNSENNINKIDINRLNLFSNIRYIELYKNNEIWLIDDKNQLFKLNPLNEKYQEGFKITLIGLESNSEPFEISNHIDLKSGKNNVSATFSAPFYLLQNGVKFSFKIDGLSTEWSQWNNLSEINLGFVPPGNYTIKFKAKNALGIETSEEQIEIDIPTPFTQSIFFYLLILMLILAIGYGLFKYRLQKLKKDKAILEQKVKERTATIENQKAKIEKQHDEITSSIRYAKRIQNAMLPHDEIIEAMLPEHFIYFSPRDIVSGDFYFFKPLGNKIIFIAADCTGHGVPGGFMSMLGISFLSEIISQLPAPSASEILDHLRDKIKLTLGQTDADSTQKDGMDISVCVIDTDNKKVQFSGAFNPLFIIRDGNLDVVKADRQPVAVYVRESTFTNNIIDVQANDCFYMFSDGYADQIGGPGQRKFMAKNFKELLLANHKLAMPEQKKILHEALDKWKGEAMQVDDILVVGFKL